MHGVLHSSVAGFVVRSSNLFSAGSFFFGLPASVSPPIEWKSLVQQSQAFPEEGERSGSGDGGSAQGHLLPPPRVLLGEQPDVKPTQVLSGPALHLPMFIDL